MHNKNFDCPYTEFGGWKGLSHGGFLPTGETAVFLLAGDRVERVWKWFVYFVKSIGSICITSLAWKEPGMVNRS